MNENKLEIQKISSKSTLLNAMILRAWKERWKDSQFGINIKKVLPRGVSGDVYNLAECILQQAIIGSTANSLFLNYLKYALSTHYISHAAVLKCISKYEHFNRTSCIEALLEFLDDTLGIITCRNKSEEAIITESVVQLLNWLMQIYVVALKNSDVNNDISEHSCMLERANSVVEKLTTNPFVICLLYIGQYENQSLYQEIRNKFESIKVYSKNANFLSPVTERNLHQLAYITVTNLKVREGHGPESIESVTYCLQPMLQFEVMLNPCNETSHYIGLLLMIQRLKNFSNTRVFYELIRASFISLSNVVETNYDTMWGAFTFFKVPFIVKQLSAHYNLVKGQSSSDHIPEVVEALELLLEDNLLLDFLDTKCTCNAVEFILNEWKKQFLVNDVHVKCFAAEREKASNILQKRDSTNQQPTVINYIIRAEGPLSGVLKTLETDYNKVQEALLGVLGQVLVGNSFDLILSVAAVEGKLKPFFARLIQCNENSKQIVGETGKIAGIRSALFDVTFLMLTAIVQRYGSHIVLSENGNSFFEHWVRNFMYEPDNPKNFKDMVALCDENIVDELLLTLRSPDAQLRNSNVTWQDTCINLVGVLGHILPAWENDILSINDIEIFLGNCKQRRLLSYSACLGSYLISYMDSVRRSEQTKPYSMTSQLLVMKCYEEPALQENHVKERLSLLKTIIKNFRQNYNQPGTFLSNIIAIPQKLTSRTILIEHFNDVWKLVSEQGWLSASGGQALQSVLCAGGPAWLTKHLVEEIIKCKYTKDMDKIVDIVFGIMHLDIVKMTSALLCHVILPIVQNRQGADINEPQLIVLARLCVCCIISALETCQPNVNTKKRPRSRECDEVEISTKLRKLGSDSLENSCSNDALNEQNLQANTPNANGSTLEDVGATLKESLQSSIQYFLGQFERFTHSQNVSPKVYFVYRFIEMLVEYGKERVRPVLQLLPANLIQNLLKILSHNDFSVGLICRLYDLRSSTGRSAAVSDLCLWQKKNDSKIK